MLLRIPPHLQVKLASFGVPPITPTIYHPTQKKNSWELYEGHLRASSARAALAAFDAEVRRLSHLKGVVEGGEGEVPLTKAEMGAVLKEVGANNN